MINAHLHHLPDCSIWQMLSPGHCRALAMCLSACFYPCTTLAACLLHACLLMLGIYHA